ncbi:hypothetical protein Lal_00004443 [Lupinus albus]|uniref:U-box domain-containing protein n=1 Tax=Lupinus albus TaxID=3870 RepID=A0A6A4NBY4_LUPAL|nr:putative aminoacyltransferase, E1 ubiquitin-activating enzyme [Lupinus albus]KAF1865069.1 hypothetical protein Lal_00004443 [Lupinus albus]
MNKVQIEITIPHLFRCPISLDLFEDPVTLSTGQTYDRSNIVQWLDAGNLTCPVTMQKLHDSSIVPNHTLRHLIDQWLQLCHQFDTGNSETIDYLASLKHTLQSHDSTLENKVQALGKIRVLSDEYCSFKKSCFIKLSFLSLLLELVFGTEYAKLSKNHMELKELALSCIINFLPLVSLEPLNMIKDESKLATFMHLFEKGTISMKISLCNLIESTASSSKTEEVCYMLGNTNKLVHDIVLFCHKKFELSKAAIKAISALCSLESNKESLVRAGAIDGVIRYISGCERKQKNLAALGMSIIEKLLVLESAKEALVNNPNGVETLVKMVFMVCNQECSEGSVEVLLIICGDFRSAREEAIGAGVLTQLLFLMQSQCATKTKTKARMLLKLLRSKWTEESKQV